MATTPVDTPPRRDEPTAPEGPPRRHPLLRPTWLVAHVIVLVVLVTFPQLGRWQWERYREEQTLDARLDARLDGEPTDLASVLPAAVDDDEAADLEFTPVEVRGTWVAGEQVAQRRPRDGSGGFDLLTPLSLGDGTAVLVRRGWVPPDRAAGADPTPDVPVGGEVVVTGFLEASARQPAGIGARDADDGVLDTVFYADVERLDRQTTDDLLPMLVHLTSQSPADGDLPLPQPAPQGDPTQNLSYTLQWFAFTAIVGIGYLIVLRRRLHDHRAGIDTDVDPLLRDRESGRAAAPSDRRGG